MNWQDIDKLIEEQKLNEAREATMVRLDLARNGRDPDEWARALIRSTQLKMALHGYETAVEALREEPWPEDEIPASSVALYYAQALVDYAETYGWEIRGRERVASTKKLDLKAWTIDQIYAEVQSTYARIWSIRERLGAHEVAELKEHIEPNDYPKGIRGTLRDAVTYLRADHLTDTRGWRPEHENELYRLDFGALASANTTTVRDADLTSPDVHPLTKVAAVLADLEAWHTSRHEEEAALETYIERIRKLHGATTDSAQKDILRRHLAKRLDEHRRVAWWSMGMSLRAELERDAGMKVAAHRTAREGQAAYPSSVGGGRCRSIAEAIEAPNFSLESMAQDSAKKRSILVHHQNLSALWFRAYALDLETRLEAEDASLTPSREAILKLVEKKPAAAWRVDLPATPDFDTHKTYVTPPLDRKGLYIVVASANEDFTLTRNRLVSVSLLVTDLVLLSRKFPDGRNEFTVLDARIGEPVAKAEVTVHRISYNTKPELLAKGRTDDAGSVVLGTSKRSYGSYLVVGRKDGDVALSSNLADFYASQGRGARSSLIYTDRSVYRPLQTLHWKVLAYQDGANEEPRKNARREKIEIQLRDPNGEIVEKREATTNAFGTASGEFTIPSGRLLGQWSLATSYNGYQWVRVEEYKRPTFETQLLDAEGALRLNKPATIKGSARYYFGLPLTQGTVSWRVTREPVYPFWYWWRTPGERTQVIATGRSAIDADGAYAITFTPEADEPKTKEARSVAYNYRVVADVTDEAGETRSAERTFVLGFISVAAQLIAEKSLVIEGDAARFTLVRTDLNGAPREGKATWRVFSLSDPGAQPRPGGTESSGSSSLAMPGDVPEEAPPSPLPEGQPNVRTEGDRLRPRWTREFAVATALRRISDGQETSAGEVVHTKDGTAQAEIKGLRAGAYRLRYSTIDDFGQTYEAFQDFLVAGSRMPIEIPLALACDRPSATVGQSVRLLVHSGFVGQPMLLEVFRAGQMVRRIPLAGGRSDAIVELPITEADRGGLGVALTMMRDHQLIQLEQSIYVPWDNKQLLIDFSTFRDKVRPGAKETWVVHVKKASPKDAVEAASELLAYMYDASLDMFAPHGPPSVLSLYPNRIGVPYLRTSLDTSSQAWLVDESFVTIATYPVLRGDRLKSIDSYGIGGLGRMGFGMAGGRGFGGLGTRGGLVRARRMMMRDEAPSESSAPPEPEVAAAAAQKPDIAKKELPGQSETKSASGKSGALEGQAGMEGAPLRTNFSETAFFLPHILTRPDGSATIEFTVPDSVTAWNVWVHAVTRDLRGGSVTKRTQSVKDLMVRPYLPRFLRESDRATIRVAVDNATERPLSGRVTLDIEDIETQKSVLSAFGLDSSSASKPFSAGVKKGTTVEFSLSAPRQPGTYAFRVVAKTTDGESDGERRPVPVLPSRMHLVQSRFATLENAATKELVFEDMKKNDDPTLIHQQLVVSIDAQLFYSVLGALPYLINYPYECTEQTLNRFVSTGILSTLYDRYPAVGTMAKKLSERATELETWDRNDPNRKLTLEETPWLIEAKGGRSEADLLANVLIPSVAKAEERASLARLVKAQHRDGGFPWFPGGPPSPYMTLYLLHGLSRAAEYKLDVPKDMVVSAWAYVAHEFRNNFAKQMIDKDCCWEFVTFLNYVASSFPDDTWTGSAFSPDERQAMLDHSFKHWKQHSPYLKAYLALTLKRMGRPKEAELVFSSIMDSSKTTPEQGTFWAQEDRSWLWYNDTIETQAFVLRAMMELSPTDSRRHGLVQWLLINKKLSHWKSTRATAEVIYALVKYLEQEGALAVREEISVRVGQEEKRFVFLPSEYTGKNNQIVVPGHRIDPTTMSRVEVSKRTKGFAFASATWHFSTDRLPTDERGDFFSVSRQYFKRERSGKEVVLRPMAEGERISVGDELEIQLSLRTKHAAEYVHLRDPRAAGFEPENAVSRYHWDLGIVWYEETRDSGANFFFEELPVGEYTFRYRLRANMAGEFRIGPATVQSMYAPEFAAYSAGHMLEVAGKEPILPSPSGR